jgi:hypothetical protein
VRVLWTLCVTGGLAVLAAGPLPAQEIRGFARLDERGDGVWGADIALLDSLGRRAAVTKSNRKGEFTVLAPTTGTYWLELTAKRLGRSSSPVFVLDSGATIYYEHTFVPSLAARVRGEDFSAQSILPTILLDSLSGSVYRGRAPTRSTPVVHVTVLDVRTEKVIPNVELVLVPISARFNEMQAAASNEAGEALWAPSMPGWYRVVGRRIGFAPGGTQSFPILGTGDSVSVALRLGPVQLLDPVTVAERQLNSYGFDIKLMQRFYLGGDALRARNPSARSIDDLISSMNVAGLLMRSNTIETQLMYRGQKVRVFILDGMRTGNTLPTILPESVESLLFIPPSEAGAVFGADAIGGVLMINTRKR